MSNINEITGDKLQSKVGDKQSKEAFDKGWDTIFSKSEAKRKAAQQELPIDTFLSKDEEEYRGCCGECH